MRGSRRLTVLRDAQRRVDGAGKGHRQQHHVRRVALDRLERERLERPVHQVGRGRERLCERLEGGLARGELLGIADELEPVVHGVAHDVGDVVQVERRQVARAVREAERPERPGERVPSFLAGGVGLERVEAPSLGKELAGGDAVRERCVAPLQERDRRIDGRRVTWVLGEKMSHPGGALRCRLRLGRAAQRRHTFAREKPQHQSEREVLLARIDAARAQKAGQIGDRRVRGVELRHRRDEAEHARRRGRHGEGG
jgi:hypothetical protein